MKTIGVDCMCLRLSSFPVVEPYLRLKIPICSDLEDMLFSVPRYYLKLNIFDIQYGLINVLGPRKGKLFKTHPCPEELHLMWRQV